MCTQLSARTPIARQPLSHNLFSHEKGRNNLHKDCLHRSHCSFINRIEVNRSHVIWPRAISHNAPLPFLGSRELIEWPLCERLVGSPQRLPVIFAAGFRLPIVCLFIFPGGIWANICSSLNEPYRIRYWITLFKRRRRRENVFKVCSFQKPTCPLGRLREAKSVPGIEGHWADTCSLLSQFCFVLLLLPLPFFLHFSRLPHSQTCLPPPSLRY